MLENDMTVAGKAFNLSETQEKKNEILHSALQLTKTIKNKKLC
jgi:hypothetical protein